MIRKSHLFWGGILILVGVLFLLDNLGVLDINFWGIIWPLLLILLGLWILMGYISREEPLEIETEKISLNGARTAKIHLHHGAGRLKIGPGSEPMELLSGSFGGGLKYTTDRREGDHLDVQMHPRDTGFPFGVFPLFWISQNLMDWDFHLTDEIPLDLLLKTGASEAYLDLTSLRITNLYLNTGASSAEVLLPDDVPYTNVLIKGGMTSLKVNIPDNVAARIRISGGLMSSDVDKIRFPKSGGYYQSPDYEIKPNKADIKVDVGVGSVIIR